MLRKSVWVVAGCLAAVAVTAHAKEEASEAEKAVEYRKAVFAAMGYNAKPIAGMVKGKIAWDGDEVAERARRLEALAGMPWEGFMEGTADVGHSETKAAAWDKRDEFRDLAEKLQERTAALVDAAESGGRSAVAESFKKVGKTCKSCHDDFKED